jgi:hypothetical protein
MNIKETFGDSFHLLSELEHFEIIEETEIQGDLSCTPDVRKEVLHLFADLIAQKGTPADSITRFLMSANSNIYLLHLKDKRSGDKYRIYTHDIGGNVAGFIVDFHGRVIAKIEDSSIVS